MSYERETGVVGGGVDDVDIDVKVKVMQPHVNFLKQKLKNGLSQSAGILQLTFKFSENKRIVTNAMWACGQKEETCLVFL